MTFNGMNQLNITNGGQAMAADLYVTERHPDLETSTSGIIEAKFAILICTARFQREGSMLNAASKCGSTKWFLKPLRHGNFFFFEHRCRHNETALQPSICFMCILTYSHESIELCNQEGQLACSRWTLIIPYRSKNISHPTTSSLHSLSHPPS